MGDRGDQRFGVLAAEQRAGGLERRRDRYGQAPTGLIHMREMAAEAPEETHDRMSKADLRRTR